MRHEAHVFGFGTLLKGWNVMDRLGEIDVPTLVLAGRFDFLFPSEHQAILADRLPNAQLEIIERAGQTRMRNALPRSLASSGVSSRRIRVLNATRRPSRDSDRCAEQRESYG
jgi:hypothetical protein